jgi:hypothetical protein
MKRFLRRLSKTQWPFLAGKPDTLDKRSYRVRRERRWSTAGVNPPGNWFAPPGSNQGSRGGNETAEASGAESR